MPPKAQGKRIDALEQSLADALSRIKSLEKKVSRLAKGKDKKDKKDKKAKNDSTEVEAKRKAENVIFSVATLRESPKKQKIQASSTENPNAAENVSGFQQIIVTDPCQEHRCYDVLGIPPSASLEDVKRAFKRRALKAHPDKEGGSQVAFMCLNKAYELLCDVGRRSIYDDELRQLRSQDGQSFKVAGSSVETHNFAVGHGNPEMLSEAFLITLEKDWSTMFKLLSDPNLHALARHLQSFLSESPEKDKHAQPIANDKRVTNKLAVPGLKSAGGGKYRGQITWDNCRVRTFDTQLDEAIEARMGLESLKQILIKNTGSGSSVDEAFCAAVEQVLQKDQNSCLYLLFSFEFVRGRQLRLTTPEVSDIKQFLDQRTTLKNIFETSGEDAVRKAHGNMVAEKKQVSIRRQANRRNLLEKMLGESYAELKRRGQELSAEIVIKRHNPPPKVVKKFQVVGDRKVGVLETPSTTASVVSYKEKGAIFDISMVHISHGLKFFQLADGSGWLPRCSRKDAKKIVVEQVDSAFDLAAILDRDADNDNHSQSGKDSASSSSSSSSSS